MLIELSSPAFRILGEEREPIVFKQGLNVVLGDKRGNNSIGKSTALMAIDFAFGGDSYVNCESVIEVGPHDVRFAFKFENEIYYFVRNSGEKDKVKQTRKDYKTVVEVLSKKEFALKLKSLYALDFYELSFREAVGLHFRIYGKKNDNEKLPLSDGNNKSMHKQIMDLIKLFDKYEDIARLDKIRDEWRDRQSKFTGSRQYGYLPSEVNNKTKFNENTVKIENLKAERASLLTGDDRFDSEEVENKNKRDELLSIRDSLNEQLSNCRKRICLLDYSIGLGLKPTEADIEALMEFFPEVNLKRIYEVEGFHNKLASILESQFIAERDEIDSKIKSLESQLENVESDINKFGFSSKYSDEFLSQISSINDQIAKLEKENTAYLESLEIKESRSKADKDLEFSVSSTLELMANSLNDKMREYNDRLFVRKRTSPVITFSSSSSYLFKTPKDDGTGTNYRGLLLFDLSLLALTKLPSISQDSHLFKNVGDEPIERLFEIYQTFRKQIFIAFDKKESYSPRMQEILEENVVLELYANGGELYGESHGIEE